MPGGQNTASQSRLLDRCDRPSFRIKDGRPGRVTLVFRPCSETVVDGDGRRYTNMYETKMSLTFLDRFDATACVLDVP